MKNEIKNYGFCLNPVEDLKAYKLGAIELPKVILRPDSQWAGWIPIDELQHTPSFDSYGCTIYGTENIQQTMERAIYGKTNEYDERYNYNILKINPPGADPHDAAESFRNDGVVSGLFPMTSTYEEYAQPRPMPTKYVSQGIAHPYMLLHQWLWTKSQSKETRTKLIKEYLQYSPLGVSVTAWNCSSGICVDSGKRNTHWTMLYGYNDKGWLIYDSYAPHRKILSYDHNIECCKRYILVPSTRKEQVSILSQILQKLSEWLGLIAKAQTTPISPVIATQPQPEPIVEPVGSKLIEWGLAIKQYEGANPLWNNPGAIRSKSGPFLKFKTYEEGWNYLLDYLTRAATGKHIAYKKGGETTLLEFQKIYSPASDNNEPNAYATFVAKRLGVTKETAIKNLV